jgi:hypothetical protein
MTLMVSRSHLAAGFAALAVIGASVTLSARLTKQEADQFSAKLNRIVQTGNAKGIKTAKATTAQAAQATQTTQISDNELNAYFKFNAKEQIPVGIVDPTINALGEGRVGGRAVVDLDAVRKQKQRGWLDPLGYMTGRLPITATGTLSTKDGVGKFNLESAEISGVTIPKTVLQELLSYYSRSKEDPDGINMDDPFELPARIREIRVGKATATIVQ